MTKHLSPILPRSHAYSELSLSHLIRATFERLWFRIWRPKGILGTLDITAKCKARHLNFVVSVEPFGPSSKISHSLCSLQVTSRPNCFGRSNIQSTERPERQLHS